MKFTIATSIAAMASVAQASQFLTVSEPQPRSYNARIAGACGGRAQMIDNLKWGIEGIEAVAREAAPKEIVFPKSCFINFKAGSIVAREISKMEGVLYVEEDGLMKSNAVASWGIDRVDQESLPLDGSFDTPWTGKDVNVYVLDTGIWDTHNDFAGRAQVLADFANEPGKDQNGHGTHCAGTIGGASFGVAREANLFGVKVLSGSGSGTYEGVMSGIRFAAGHSPDASVLSMSLGGGFSQAVNDAVQEASDMGNIVVVASGNDNKDACDYSPASAGGKGAAGGVITVNSSTRSDRRSSFSNYGTCTDIFAPGSDIKSSWIGSNSATRTISGTSMACPHVAGVAATLLQKNGGNKNGAISDLFDLAATGKISNSGSGSPNRLVQVSKDATPTSPPVADPTASPTSPPVVDPTSPPVADPTSPPVAAPTNAPPTTAPPTGPGEWNCPAEWFDSGDGCDCECGGGDPDCESRWARLYCNGRAGKWWEFCNFNEDRCVSIFGISEADVSKTGRTLEDYPSKLREGSSSGSGSLMYALGGAGAVGAVAVAAAVVVTRRNKRAIEEAVAVKQINPETDF